MAFDFIALKKAAEDLNKIIDFIASDNPEAALELYETFLKQFEYISLNKRTILNEYIIPLSQIPSQTQRRCSDSLFA